MNNAILGEFYFHHISVVASDLKWTHQFYSDFIGLQEIPRPTFSFQGIWYDLNRGVELHIIINPNYPTLSLTRAFSLDSPHLALKVADLELVCRAAKQKGYENHINPESLNGPRQLFVLDPDQNVVEFSQP